jgi:hypothetical protein
VRTSPFAIALVLGIAAACGASPTVRPPSVLHDVVVKEKAGVQVDMYLPSRPPSPAPWLIFAAERSSASAGIAEAMQRRGIAVGVLSFAATTEPRTVAASIRELTARAADWGLDARPTLAGDERGASLMAWLALDPSFSLDATKVRGVVAMNGVYDGAVGLGMHAAIDHVRPDAPPFLVLSAHGDSPRSAQSTRAFVRALERAGALRARSYHVAASDAPTLARLVGERNDVGDLVTAFARGAEVPGGAESPWAIADAWGPNAPLSTEPFWSHDRGLVVRRPVDDRLRAQLRRVYGATRADAAELEPWPAVTYDAIDLGEYLRAHPELGSGDWIEVTNARSEKLVLRRDEIERDKPVIVVGLDDERNLFRLLVTYSVRREYSWEPEAVSPVLARPVGAFLHLTSAVAHPPFAVTLADFALTTASFRVSKDDPLAAARAVPPALARTLTNEQGCLQCHTLRGAGARSHHRRARDGAPTGGYALAFEDYPAAVLRRFLFEQEAVARSFGVNPIGIDPVAATELMQIVFPDDR